MKTTGDHWISLWRKLRDEHAILAAMAGNVDLSLDQRFPGEQALLHLRIAARADMRVCEARRRWVDARRETAEVAE